MRRISTPGATPTISADICDKHPSRPLLSRSRLTTSATRAARTAISTRSTTVFSPRTSATADCGRRTIWRLPPPASPRTPTRSGATASAGMNWSCRPTTGTPTVNSVGHDFRHCRYCRRRAPILDSDRQWSPGRGTPLSVTAPPERPSAPTPRPTGDLRERRAGHDAGRQYLHSQQHGLQSAVRPGQHRRSQLGRLFIRQPRPDRRS